MKGKFLLASFSFFALLLTVFAVAVSVQSSVNDLKINELVSNPFTGGTDWVEIYNTGGGSVSLSGCKFVDFNSTNQLSISGIIGSNGFLAFNWSNRLNSGGDTVSLVCGNATIDTVGFGDKGDAFNPETNQSIGRCDDGDDTNNDANDFEIFNSTNITKGTANICSVQQPIFVGCINVKKEARDLSGNLINPTPQFTFVLNNGQQTVHTSSQGVATFYNVPTGSNTISEDVPFGWQLSSVTPAGGVVNVNSGNNCVNVTFKNQQNLTQQNPVCGNGVLESGELCDDGNLINGDGCSNQCTVEPFCGDGNLDFGETCDDGNNANGDGCNSICENEPQIPICGNGVRENGEQCDDGNTNNNDLCRNNCMIPLCGDGITDSNEQCDDGNTNNNDLCSNTCNIVVTQPRCGDGIINQPSEQCDGGPTCTTNCKIKSNGITPIIDVEEFPPRVWLCDSRAVYDDNTEPGRISGPGQPLVERINNYVFEGEQIQWTVFVMDKNKIDQGIDVYATIGKVQGEGNNIEVNCQRISSSNVNLESCNARIGEEHINEAEAIRQGIGDTFRCTLTVETPVSMHGEYWVTVEAQDLDGLLGTMDENEFWFLNPEIALNIEGDLGFDNVRPGTSSYSQTLLLGNGAEPSSGVMLDMFITGTDFYDSSHSGARCPTTNQLSLSNFRYFATNGGYSTYGAYPAPYFGPTADAEGYKGIAYGIGFNNPNPFYNKAEIIPKQNIATAPYYAANLLAPGAEMALTFKLDMPEPCNGDYDSGNIYFWGEAV